MSSPSSSSDDNPFNDTFYCRKCDLTYSVNCEDSSLPYTQESFVEHKASAHNLCKKCGRHYLVSRLKEHEDKFHPYECTLCFKRFCSRFSLYRHKKAVHNAFPCILCNNIDANTHGYEQYFDTTKRLRDHVKEHHPDQELHVCDYKSTGCPSVFTTPDELVKHQRTVHKKECLK